MRAGLHTGWTTIVGSLFTSPKEAVRFGGRRMRLEVTQADGRARAAPAARDRVVSGRLRDVGRPISVRRVALVAVVLLTALGSRCRDLRTAQWREHRGRPNAGVGRSA